MAALRPVIAGVQLQPPVQPGRLYPPRQMAAPGNLEAIRYCGLASPTASPGEVCRYRFAWRTVQWLLRSWTFWLIRPF